MNIPRIPSIRAQLIQMRASLLLRRAAALRKDADMAAMRAFSTSATYWALHDALLTRAKQLEAQRADLLGEV